MDEQLILDHLHLVRAIAWRYRSFAISPWLDVEDLRQEAAIGLLQAAKRYDTEKSSSFSAYAWLVMKGAIIQGVRNMSSLTRSQMEWVAQGQMQEPSFVRMDHHEHIQVSDKSASENEVYERIDVAEFAAGVREYVDKLHIRHRHAALRFLLDGIPRAEAAKEAGISDVAMSQVVMRLMRRLRIHYRLQIKGFIV